MSELADIIKRLRVDANDPTEAIQTINQLFELVAELYDPADAKQESDALTKAAPIAALKG